jgi:hypothetical protein
MGCQMLKQRITDVRGGGGAMFRSLNLPAEGAMTGEDSALKMRAAR